MRLRKAGLTYNQGCNPLLGSNEGDIGGCLAKEDNSTEDEVGDNLGLRLGLGLGLGLGVGLGLGLGFEFSYNDDVQIRTVLSSDAEANSRPVMKSSENSGF